MTRIRRSQSFLVLLLGLFTCASLRVAGHDGEIWRQPLRLDGGAPVVDVWIGSRGPWRFALDTGAEGSTVSREVADRLGLPVLGAVERHTMAGIDRLPLVRVANLRLGRVAPRTIDVTAAVSDLRMMRELTPDVDGVLGGDALTGVDYVIDYRERRLTLAYGELPADERQGDVELPLRFERQRPIVMWPRAAGLAPLPLVVDTGAGSLIVDAKHAGSFRCRRFTRLTVRLDTHAGSRAAPACEVEPLRAGSIEISGLQMVAIPWPAAIDRIDRGLLPASAFARVYVSTRRSSLTLWAR